MSQQPVQDRNKRGLRGRLLTRSRGLGRTGGHAFNLRHSNETMYVMWNTLILSISTFFEEKYSYVYFSVNVNFALMLDSGAEKQPQ